MSVSIPRRRALASALTGAIALPAAMLATRAAAAPGVDEPPLPGHLHRWLSFMQRPQPVPAVNYPLDRSAAQEGPDGGEHHEPIGKVAIVLCWGDHRKDGPGAKTGAEALERVAQSRADKGADAEGFADALDLGGAF